MYALDDAPHPTRLLLVVVSKKASIDYAFGSQDPVDRGSYHRDACASEIKSAR